MRAQTGASTGEVINSSCGGENVYLREIEEFLYTHPDITDVQVVGVPDERYMTVTGKIQKFKLRGLAIEQLGLQTALVETA